MKVAKGCLLRGDDTTVGVVLEVFADLCSVSQSELCRSTRSFVFMCVCVCVSVLSRESVWSFLILLACRLYRWRHLLVEGGGGGGVIDSAYRPYSLNERRRGWGAGGWDPLKTDGGGTPLRTAACRFSVVS